MAVVKANAYGHGMLPVARAALQAGATWCGVARLEEALALRAGGVECPVLILGYTPAQRMGEAIAAHVSLTVWDERQIEQAALAAKAGPEARLHLKVDTGMSRLGVPPEDAPSLAARIARTPHLIFEGVFTHFARADEADPTPTDVQQERFEGVLLQLERAGLRPRWVHAANSAASLRRPSAHYDLLRVGIAMYGLHPSHECRLPADFRPALTWKAVLSQVKRLPPGRGVSYGHIYTTASWERIGTIPVGYADGFRRTQGHQVLVGGRRVPVVGRVCMDQIMVQLDEVPQAQAGDEVVLIGQQGAARLSAEEVAQVWGTINYEVTCAIGARVPRLYLHESDETSAL
jgi:alanine racemase